MVACKLIFYFDSFRHVAFILNIYNMLTTKYLFYVRGLSAFYTHSANKSEEEKLAVLKHAYDSGCTLFNTAAFYGPLTIEGYGSNLKLLNKFLKMEGVDRSKIKLMVKIGMDTRAPVTAPGTQWNLSGKEDFLRADMDFVLSTLGVEYIDIAVMCRVPNDTSIEEVVSTFQKFINEGKIKHIGLSEASSEVLKRANKIAKIYCIEQEYSLWSRDLEIDILPTCRELGILIIAYSPLGRGFLTNTINREELSEYDIRSHGQPRFTKENFQNNQKLVDSVKAIALRKNITEGQLALAYLVSLGDDIIPIPGTSSIKHLDMNIQGLKMNLTIQEVEEINNIFQSELVLGDRYATPHLTFHGGGNLGQNTSHV